MPIYGHLVPQRWSRPAAALGESERRRQSSREAPPAPPKENNTQFTPSTAEGKRDSEALGEPLLSWCESSSSDGALEI